MRYIIFLFMILGANIASAQNYFLAVGSYTGSGSKGIYLYKFDAATGKVALLSHTDSGSVTNPSYLAFAPNGKTLYACTETRMANAGGVSAFAFNRAAGTLRFVNKQTSGGDNPAYVAVSPNGKWVTAGNYSGGSVAIFATSPDGGIQPYSQLMQHKGSSINKARQEAPHVHATVFSPDGDYLFAPDLGLDKVVAYRFKPGAVEPIAPLAALTVNATPGSGPRHFIFSANGKYAYLMQEMAGTVVAYSYSKGKLVKMQEIAAHPDTAKGEFSSADIHLSPDGKFLYTSNRGAENNIAIFSVNAANGALTPVGYQSTLGKKPRNFCIDPSGNFLLVANQDSGNVVVFKRDKVTGLLSPTGTELNIPEPVCLMMMK